MFFSTLKIPVVTNQGLVAAVVVANQRSASATEEVPGMLAGPAVGKVVDHALPGLEGSGTVGPQVGPMGLAGAGI